MDPQFAEVQYRWGECLLALTNFAGAREQFQTACDDDALPFRADSRINGAIQKVGEQFAGDRLTFFDAAAALGETCRRAFAGRKHFYEHVHFNFDGNYRLGHAGRNRWKKCCPPTSRAPPVTNVWVSQETCDRLLGLTDWNRCAVTEMMIDRLHHPPLSDQSNNAERMQWLRDEVNRFAAADESGRSATGGGDLPGGNQPGAAGLFCCTKISRSSSNPSAT